MISLKELTKNNYEEVADVFSDKIEYKFQPEKWKAENYLKINFDSVENIEREEVSNLFQRVLHQLQKHKSNKIGYELFNFLSFV